ncbi:MAG: glycoside hydrolase family 16 protein [Acutalibacteraceae bacterium]|nr:glycoside hydrolase family 16 protein [Acutalibacteraceae bacterium]
MNVSHDELLKNGYKVVFEDHFDGEDLDPQVWERRDVKQKGHFDRTCWRNPKNIFTKDSCMVIKGSIDEDEEGKKRYNCGIVQVKNFCYKYGYAEARAKIAVAGPGIWMGFWMKSDHKSANVNSEIDVCEMFGDDTRIASNIHGWWADRNYNMIHRQNFLDGNNYPKQKILENGERFSDKFHRFGYLWTPEYVEFLVDGECHCRIDITNPMFKLCHTPIYFLFSMAYGNAAVAPPDDNRTEPIEFCIDYIRLYQNEDGELYDMSEDKYLTKREK